jgi:hypothetical protein
MTQLYVIAHKVRSEPAFDIAVRIDCPICEGDNDVCHECDDKGYWWIIPTSGHRAYPYDWTVFDEPAEFRPMPDGWIDHYIHNTPRQISLAESLGITKPKPPALPPIVRRI